MSPLLACFFWIGSTCLAMVILLGLVAIGVYHGNRALGDIESHGRDRIGR